MSQFESLMNDKYILLKHIYMNCIWSKGEYLLQDTIDQMVIDTGISKRKICSLLKELESDKFICKSKVLTKKYQISVSMYEQCNNFFNFINSIGN